MKYQTLYDLLDQLDAVQQDYELMDSVRYNFGIAMKPFMDTDYLSASIEPDASLDELTEDQLIAMLTAAIRSDRFIEGNLAELIERGSIASYIRALENLEKKNLNIESQNGEKFLLNDLLLIDDLSNVKIRLSLQLEGNWNPIEIFESGEIDRVIEGHYHNYSKQKRYKVGDLTIGLLRINPKENLYLLAHIGIVTADLDVFDGVGYEYQTVPKYEKYVGRVVIKYKNKVQNLVRNGASLMPELEVHQVLPHVYNNDNFVGYDSVNVSWENLKTCLEKESWKTALKNQKAVYLIVDEFSGKMYVGSAYGENMLYNRWLEYIQTGHGNNKELKQLDIEYIKKNFRYSILDIFKSTIDDEVILKREAWWKQTLLTRKFGYNMN